MEIEDEINQINSIINKLDVIRDDEWQKKEDETEEEFNNRLEVIEEELEEELLDYISDSLLAEQEINEEEAIKEAQEKIRADYELFSDAFIKSDNGIITLKSEEELTTLGYDTPEEVEKLNSIAENINSPEIYINKIKDNIHASKDIDAEIDRKMELAKTIIAAKKRGETLPSSLNPSIEKDKFEKANAYIANTTTLRKVPFVQNEYINNNYIAERKYNNVIRNITTNTTTKSTSGRTATTNTTSQATTPVISATETKIVTRKIPERKNTLYTNFEKKLDKTNDLTKQKIKARTELKGIFKDYSLSLKSGKAGDLSALKDEIKRIENKFPNLITEELVGKIAKQFSIDLEDKIKNSNNINPENNTENDLDCNAQTLQPPIDTQTIAQEDITAESINPPVIPEEQSGKLKQHDANKKIDEDNANQVIPAQTSLQSVLTSENSQPHTKNDQIEAKNQDAEKFDSRREDILKMISDFDADRNTVFKMHERYLFFIPSYLKTNNDSYVRNKFNSMLDTLEKGLQDDFVEKLNSHDIPFNIGLLDNLYQLYDSENGLGVVNQDRKKAIEFLHKELNYFANLRTQVYSANNSIERIKNEAKFSDALVKLKGSELSRKIPVMPLVIEHELAKRNKETSNVLKMVSTYKERIKNGSSVSEVELDELGKIAYEGIKDLSGNVILAPDEVFARDIYTKLVNDYGDKRIEANYNRLYSLYSDNTLPTYDEQMANTIKEKMKQKGITITKIEKSSNKKTKNNSQTFVCSDLHGQYETYKAITKRLKNKDKLYILGDVIDRGPGGIKILQDIMRRKSRGQVEFLVGNHELMMIQSLILNDEQARKNWEQRNGGDITRKAFEGLSTDEQSEIKNFLLDSCLYKNINIDSQQVHLTHAKAIQDENSSQSKTVREMISDGKLDLMAETLWFRGEDAISSKKISRPGSLTIIGHTPTESKMIEYKDGYIDIDCGAGEDKKASLVNLSSGTVEYFDVQKERAKEDKNR